MVRVTHALLKSSQSNIGLVLGFANELADNMGYKGCQQTGDWNGGGGRDQPRQTNFNGNGNGGNGGSSPSGAITRNLEGAMNDLESLRKLTRMAGVLSSLSASTQQCQAVPSNASFGMPGPQGAAPQQFDQSAQTLATSLITAFQNMNR